MLQIIESICSGPIRFLPDLKSNGKLRTGLIAELTEIQGNTVCTLSDGRRPFGIVGEILENPFGMIPIWFETMVFRTNVFERKVPYEVGAPLYVSQRGMLTSQKPFEFAHIVGQVNAVPNGSRGHLEVNWI